ncbi:PIN domain nuclease [Bacillus methanolicus]|uniref:PIN domain-containing protein n=1 Tax=Bacillus methanolicus TaxID=1471 RepID=UPI00238094D3|nr:PIN domain-containing protein [Bacillus methanolicus]MDE3840654.1 PIN domain nuclease [Bacillus methanolicus]
MQHLLDANAIVRFLTNDDPKQSPVAYRLFEKATKGEIQLVLTPLVITECCWVLQSKRYGYSKAEIAEKLSLIISANGIKTTEKEIVQKALFNYSTHNVDFVDAYLSATAQFSEVNSIITWNEKDFKRLGVEFYTPEQVLNTK